MSARFFKSLTSILWVATFFVGMMSACRSTHESLQGIKKVNDLEEMGLQGAVQSMTVKNYRASKNRKTGAFIKKDLSKAQPQNVAFKFNENGNVVEKKGYDGEEQLKTSWEYEYNDKKRTVTEEVFNHPEEKPAFRRINSYDKKGNKIKHLEYVQGEEDPYKETFKYDKGGNILEEVRHKSDGLLKTVYEYDEKGHLLKRTTLQNEEVQEEETFDYDEQGELMSSEQTEDRAVHADYRITKKYKNGKEKERTLYRDGAFEGRYVYQYDDQGNQTGFQKYDAENRKVSESQTVYKYDDQKNWIQQIPLDPRGLPQYIKEREIIYEN